MMLTHRVLSHADAMHILQTILNEVQRRGVDAAVAVVDDHGELMTFARTDGCKLPPITIAQNKAFTAAREHRDSLAIGDSSRRDHWPLSNFGDGRYTGWEGGVPIVVDGRVVGGVGVSGLTGEEDGELARIGAAALVG